MNNEFKSGLISGTISTIICNPFDVIRTNRQINSNIYRSGDFNFIFKGLKSSLITIPTFWSIYFPLYNNFKTNNYGIISGYLAANIASTITCPLWLIRQKNQTEHNFDVKKFYKKNGLLSFYNALFPTYLVNSSFLIYMPLYEILKTNISHSENTLSIFFISSFSKIIATLFFYPFDTIRSIKRHNNEYYIQIIKNLNKSPLKYYNGISYYLLRCIPYYTTTFCTYEYLKNK